MLITASRSSSGSIHLCPLGLSAAPRARPQAASQLHCLPSKSLLNQHFYPFSAWLQLLKSLCCKSFQFNTTLGTTLKFPFDFSLRCKTFLYHASQCSTMYYSVTAAPWRSGSVITRWTVGDSWVARLLQGLLLLSYWVAPSSSHSCEHTLQCFCHPQPQHI